MMLEPRTMFFVLAVGNTILALAIGLSNASGSRVRALNTWASACALAAAAWGLYALRDVVPFAVSVLGGFGALTLSFLVQTFAIADFTERRLPRTAACVAWLVSVVTLGAVFAVTYGDERTLVIWASLGVGLWTLAPALAFIFFAPLRSRALYRFTAAVLAASAACDAYRGLHATVSTTPTMSLLDINLTQSLTFGMSFVAMMATSLAFLVMGKERAEGALLQIAATDPLTGLLNRRAFDEHIHREFSRAARASSPISVAMFDLDHFKEVNDTHGHQAGDAVLRSFAAIVATHARESDVAARYGGEEFCIVFTSSSAHASQAAERIRISAAADIVTFGGTTITYTVSAGVAAGEPTAESPTCTIERADQALYNAKCTGRNRITVSP
ncbi:MAG: GGDEF domain-containing protein [bacterium]|nr:GGDEF domain-containing protein [bacterium]